MAVCGTERGHLAPIRDCADLANLKLDMEENLYPSDKVYHVGNFYKKQQNGLARRSNPLTDEKTDS